jgi:hypothetical protein
MTYFKRDRFSGIVPAVSARLIADQFAQVAENVDFESGRLVATTEDKDVFALQGGGRQSIYLYRDVGSGTFYHWLEWDNKNISAVPGPIPGDVDKRLYYTGDDYPRVGTYTSMVSGGSGYPAVSYRLGVPAPTDTPDTLKIGTADPDQTPDDISYVYTLVTALGEEGPPSPASAVITKTDTESVTVGTPTPSLDAGYNFGAGALKRLYRSNSGSRSTAYQYVGEAPFTQNSILDNLTSDSLSEVLPSATWIGPPDNNTSLYPAGPMQGLMSLSNGVMAGFSGKRFCLSEPYLPHAWPINYRITTEDDIVAIVSTAGGVAALTAGQPYFITGVDPSAMTAVRIDLAQACINVDSVVDMGDYALYAGPDGLCAVQAASGRVVTRGLISAAQWRDESGLFKPKEIKAFRYEGTYVALWTDGSNHGGWVYDPRSEAGTLSTLSMTAEVRGGFTNPDDGNLYFITGNKIRSYRAADWLSRTLRYKSKKFLSPKPVSMGWLSVEANEWPVTVKVWADEVLVADYHINGSAGAYTQTTTVPSGINSASLTEPLMRMPAVTALQWEVQVEGTDINSFCLAQSIDEVRGS